MTFRFKLKRFLSYYKPYLGLFFAVITCAFIVATIALILPLCVRHSTKIVLENGLADSVHQMYSLGALMLILVAIQAVCGFFYDYRGHAMGAMMESDMRSQLFDQYQRLSFSFYDEQKIGQLMSRITNDLFSLVELYHHGPEDLIIYSVRFVGAFVILMHINAQLTLAVFVFIPIMAIFTIYFNKKLNRAYRSNKEKISDINAQVEDTLSGIRVVKSFTNEKMEKQKFSYENSHFLNSRKMLYKTEAYFTSGIGICIQLITVTVVVFGGLSITKTSLDLADLITFLLYIGYLTEPIQRLTHMITQYQEGITGFERFMEIMELEPDIQDAAEPKQVEQVRGHVQFIDVRFRYNESHHYVLKNISLDVQAGEYIALVGASGAGKTTLCSLIPRFYEISEGELLIDGFPIKEISLRSLRRNVGVVQQEVYLFAGTVLANIGYGKPGASKEEIIAAAKKANAHPFIMELPDGYDTDIGQRGVKLSGGQKQRVSIARVFLKNPPILIFDEATSALDHESEKVVQDSMERLAKNRTTFVIAHRLSTIKNAKRIVVLTEQGIEEQGTHQELLTLGGTYAHLYHMQWKG